MKIEAQEKIPVGVSSCLLGEQVRYDGGHKEHHYLLHTLGKYFSFHPFCPEIDIGLGVPREPVHLIKDKGEIKSVGTKDVSLDVTQALISCADQQKKWHEKISGYFVKAKSPSCGIGNVPVNENGKTRKEGTGIYVLGLKRNFPNLPIEDEFCLEDPTCLGNFIQRIMIYHRWLTLFAKPVTAVEVYEFHQQHRHLLQSHDYNMTSRLDILLNDISDFDILGFCTKYINEVMQILQIPATREKHVRLLQQIHERLIPKMEQDDHTEINQVIHQYKDGNIPLLDPICLLVDKLGKFRINELDESFYLDASRIDLVLVR